MNELSSLLVSLLSKPLEQLSWQFFGWLATTVLFYLVYGYLQSSAGKFQLHNSTLQLHLLICSAKTVKKSTLVLDSLSWLLNALEVLQEPITGTLLAGVFKLKLLIIIQVVIQFGSQHSFKKLLVHSFLFFSSRLWLTSVFTLAKKMQSTALSLPQHIAQQERLWMVWMYHQTTWLQYHQWVLA